MSEIVRASVERKLATTAIGKGADMVDFDSTFNYVVGSIGAAVNASCVNVARFPWLAKCDGVTDDYAAIQAALNNVPHGGAIYIPNLGADGSGVNTGCYVSAGLVLAKNDVTIFGDPCSEYSNGLFTDQAIDILTCTGYGLRVDNLVIRGNGTQTDFATTNGLVIDRSSGGDAETYSNLDATITNCTFFDLNDGVRGVGRNVVVNRGLVSRCKRGIVGELHTYAGGTVSSFRGWRISGVRFHSCGGQYIDVASTETLPATLDLLDSWCIQMPVTSNQTAHLEISNNNADFCGAGFYRGYLAGAFIHGNQTHGGTSAFVYAKITDAGNQSASSNFVSRIYGNQINSRTADQATDRGVEFSYNTVYAFGVANLEIKDNSMFNAAKEHILVTACARASVIDNTCANGNMLFVDDATQRNCIWVDQSANATVRRNKVFSAIGTVHDFGIRCTSTTGLSIGENDVRNSTVPITCVATDLVTANCEGLPWQTPVMTNAWTLTAGSWGYRRMFNGKVQINVRVAAGTDNTSAFTLPLGYRPAIALTVPVVGVFNTAYAFIDTNGTVVINWDASAASSNSLIVEFEAA